jgi:hypothetical protein
MLTTATNYQVKITQVRFAPSLIIGKSEAHIVGLLEPDSSRNVCRFALTAEYDLQTRLWSIGLPNFRWTSPVGQSLFDFRNIQSVCKRVLVGFRILRMQPITAENVGGAKIQVGHTLMNAEQEQASFAIFRGDILTFYRLGWSHLWSAIDNRLSYDPEFWVNGFTRQDAVRAVAVLKSIFPWEWTRKRYRSAAKNPSTVGMWNEMQADQGFPAYHFARTAIGCICKDPGWNYLITLAQSCNNLNSYPRGPSFLKRIASNPGDIHHANFAGYLHQRGMLAEIEPPTGSGSATNDLAAKIGETIVDIEMKSLTSNEPARQIGQEVLDKCRKLPALPKRPIVFFALLVEKSSAGEAKTQQQQLDSITTSLMKNTAGVSAVVVGRMFIDSAGGPIKWNFEKFLINEQAHHRVDELLLRQIFKPNWERICYPCLPFVFSYNLNAKSSSAAV